MAASQAAFEDVAMPHLDSVYRIARRLVGNEAEAEDLVQETFLRAFRAFDGFELRRYGARPWLLKILHNAFYTRAARRSREPAQLDEVDFDTFPREDQAAGVSAATIDWEGVDERLKAAILSLTPEYREVLLLWALEDLSYKEIAEVCGCAIGTVMSRLFRARQQVSKRLEATLQERREMAP